MLGNGDRLPLAPFDIAALPREHVRDRVAGPLVGTFVKDCWKALSAFRNVAEAPVRAPRVELAEIDQSWLFYMRLPNQRQAADPLDLTARQGGLRMAEQ
jgi:hypothetical protein